MTTLTTDQKRVLIAENFGWTRCYDNPHLHGQMLGWDCSGKWKVVPDYFSDLNACADMERSLEGEMRHDYVRTLCGMMNGWEMMPDFTTTFAAAAQRAEAFGITKGLWT